MSDFLTEVASRTRQRVQVEKDRVPTAVLQKHIRSMPPTYSFRQALQSGALSVIAELKQASPSAGIIRKVDQIDDRIHAYERGGAKALSILTEEDYFHGSPQLLEQARKLTLLPLLRKDFIVDPYQILETRALGADALLLIVSLLSGPQLTEFIQLSQAAGLDALVEVHTEAELDQAIVSKATIIGVNNRNLHTLKVDPSTAPKLLQVAPKGKCIFVIESGIKDPKELPMLRSLGAQAVLIGEALMRTEYPENLVREFATACQK